MTRSTEPEIGLATPARHTPSRRDSGVDLVRAAALIRVITFHGSGNFVVLTVIPAMPIMFFLGGTYMERSLGRRPTVSVVFGRFKRMALPAVVYIVLAVIGLVLAQHELRSVMSSLLEALLPRNNGAGTPDGVADWLFSTLWYLRDYIALAAMSPILSRLLQVNARVTLGAAGALVVAGITLGAADSTAMYVAFWLLGMSGLLSRWVERTARGRAKWLAIGGAVAGAIAVVLVDQGSAQTLGASLAGIGWLIGIDLLRDPIHNLAIRPKVSRAVDWIMTRAVSIYLWQMVPIVIMFRLAEPNRSLEQAIDALWIIPLSIIATFILATIFAPIERFAARS